MKRRQALLAGTNGLLTMLLVWEIFWPHPELPTAPAAPPPSPQTGAPPPLSPQLLRQQFAASDERPLFTPTRSPFREAAAPSTTEVPPPPPSVRLVGILRDGKHQLALLKPPNAPAFTVAPDQDVEGWILTEITADQVSFQAGTAIQILNLHEHQP